MPEGSKTLLETREWIADYERSDDNEGFTVCQNISREARRRHGMHETKSSSNMFRMEENTFDPCNQDVTICHG